MPPAATHSGCKATPRRAKRKTAVKSKKPRGHAANAKAKANAHAKAKAKAKATAAKAHHKAAARKSPRHAARPKKAGCGTRTSTHP